MANRGGPNEAYRRRHIRPGVQDAAIDGRRRSRITPEDVSHAGKGAKIPSECVRGAGLKQLTLADRQLLAQLSGLIPDQRERESW